VQELREHLNDLWDKQFEDDVKAGRLDQAIARARRERVCGETNPESCGSFRAALRSSDEHAG
jgi:hypothetical protein